MNAINYICPVCKHRKDIPKDIPATCNYCSEQMIPTASVRGQKVLDQDKEKTK
jgi:DNA-directed RNA polymerase subunit RPC12/RpoP